MAHRTPFEIYYVGSAPDSIVLRVHVLKHKVYTENLQYDS